MHSSNNDGKIDIDVNNKLQIRQTNTPPTISNVCKNNFVFFDLNAIIQVNLYSY
jgi:hypothetical protein